MADSSLIAHLCIEPPPSYYSQAGRVHVELVDGELLDGKSWVANVRGICFPSHRSLNEIILKPEIHFRLELDGGIVVENIVLHDVVASYCDIVEDDIPLGVGTGNTYFLSAYLVLASPGHTKYNPANPYP